jgi:uncharacterized membrane protein (UPF0127 family)
MLKRKHKTIRGVYIARDFFARFWGLMGRFSWTAKHNGIYFPNCRAVHTFYTFLRPDLVFVDKKGKILKIIASAKPWRVFVGPAKSRDCLELPCRKALELGLKEGTVIQLK